MGTSTGIVLAPLLDALQILQHPRAVSFKNGENGASSFLFTNPRGCCLPPPPPALGRVLKALRLSRPQPAVRVILQDPYTVPGGKEGVSAPFIPVDVGPRVRVVLTMAREAHDLMPLLRWPYARGHLAFTGCVPSLRAGTWADPPPSPPSEKAPTGRAECLAPPSLSVPTIHRNHRPLPQHRQR